MSAVDGASEGSDDESGFILTKIHNNIPDTTFLLA
jgi:hypothetical protein